MALFLMLHGKFFLLFLNLHILLLALLFFDLLHKIQNHLILLGLEPYILQSILFGNFHFPILEAFFLLFQIESIHLHRYLSSSILFLQHLVYNIWLLHVLVVRLLLLVFHGLLLYYVLFLIFLHILPLFQIYFGSSSIIYILFSR